MSSENDLTQRALIVQLLLSHHVIQDEQRQAAMYRRSLKGLYLQIRNFNAMCLILNCMGYSLIEFSNTTVRASEVLQYFNWAPTSFHHKSGWYGAVKVLSQHNLEGNPPGK
jgi:hypothetical protein